jgi:hypothetical protein
VGEEASQRRIEENKVGTMQALVDSGVAQKENPPESDKGPSKSISFKDLPPEGQTQLAAQAGIDISPESVLTNQVTNQLIKGGSNASQNGKQFNNSEQ